MKASQAGTLAAASVTVTDLFGLKINHHLKGEDDLLASRAAKREDKEKRLKGTLTLKARERQKCNAIGCRKSDA